MFDRVLWEDAMVGLNAERFSFLPPPFFFWFLGPHLWHMNVLRLGVESGLQLRAYTTATATTTQDLSHVWDIHHSSWQRRIPNLLSEARDWTHNLMVTSQIPFYCATTGTPKEVFLQDMLVRENGNEAWEGWKSPRTTMRVWLSEEGRRKEWILDGWKTCLHITD